MTSSAKSSYVDQCRRVIAFDGDDTLWIDTTAEQAWERHFRHLVADRLPRPEMARLFRARLNEYGFTLDGVRRALLTAGRETCPHELPHEWQEQVQALPELMPILSIRPAPGLDQILASLKRTGTPLWIITKGDLIRQAIKIASFGHVDAFSNVEIVPRKTQATYRHILDARGTEPRTFMMIGDSFAEDVLPVLRLGGHAVHVPAGRWAILRPFEQAFQSRRFRVCRSLAHAQHVCRF